MKKMSEYLFLWAVGGCLYYTFEIVFRGFSHWTMFVLGGCVWCFALPRAGQVNGGIPWVFRLSDV